MTFNTWLIYAAAVFVLTVTPGPTVLTVVSTSVNGGLRQAMLAASGSITAAICMMGLSAVGLGAVLATSETLFTALKWAGAAYLAYLGVGALLSKGQAFDLRDVDASSSRQSFVRGVLVGASNPKALVFFAALFPQFIDPAQAQWPQFVVLCTTFIAFEVFWLCTYAALGAKAKNWLQQPSRAKLFNRATGAVFLLAASALATAKRAAAQV